MTQDWYGRKADKAVPFTDSFIKAAIAQGALVPPLDWLPFKERMGIKIGILLVLLAFSAVIWAQFLVNR